MAHGLSPPIPHQHPNWELEMSAMYPSPPPTPGSNTTLSPPLPHSRSRFRFNTACSHKKRGEKGQKKKEQKTHPAIVKLHPWDTHYHLPIKKSKHSHLNFGTTPTCKSTIWSQGLKIKSSTWFATREFDPAGFLPRIFSWILF